MKEALQKWVAACLSKPGALGAGVLLPDGSAVRQSTDDEFDAGKIEAMLRKLSGSHVQLFDAELPSRWSTWVFEQGKVRCVYRADGLLFAFAVRVDTEAAQNLDQLAEEFLALKI